MVPTHNRKGRRYCAGPFGYRAFFSCSLGISAGQKKPPFRSGFQFLPKSRYAFFALGAAFALTAFALAGLAALAGWAFFALRLAALISRALARLSANPLSWAILRRASEKFFAVRAWLLGMPNCFLYSPGFKPWTLARWRARVFIPPLPQIMQNTWSG